jgi:hypothetical protein
MSRIALAMIAAMALGSARAADYVDIHPPRVAPPVTNKVPLPGGRILQFDENVQPLINLGAFWSEVRRSETAAEVALRLDGRFRGLPVTFQGINTETGTFQRVSIVRAYRRAEDDAIDLPAVTFDTVTDGITRTVTIPLWSGVRINP